MTVAVPALRRLRVPARGVDRARGTVRAVASFLLIAILLVVAWEAAKFVAGTPWREVMGIPLDPPHDPPFRIKQLSDLNLPHVWNVIGALFEPATRGAPFPLVAVLIDAAIFTWRGAAIGFVIGALFGFGLAVVFVHSRLLERAFVPYVIASQTIPIIALAPMIVLWFGRDWLAVALISAYLTFFPVTIGGIRGLSSPDTRALELMSTYAASRWTVLWKVRVPASLPYLFTALKIGATASVVGAIVGEAPTGLAGGLGRTLVTFNQYYLTGPEKLWAAILVTAALGILFFSLVRIVELIVLSGQPTAVEG